LYKKMTKKLTLSLLVIIILVLIGFFIYRNLPLEITRKADITFGNTLIKNIEKYKLDYKKLPVDDELGTIQKIGFQNNEVGTKPHFAIDSKGNYEIAFLEGFDPPYLIWNSIDKKWKIDFQKIFSNSV